MKKFLVVMMVSFFGFLSANAQSEIPTAENLKVSVDNKNLTISWESNSSDASWKLEASEDNENFKAIGLVWGAMPGKANAFLFKQASQKLSKQFKYYRAVAVTPTGDAWAGAAVQLSK